MKIADKLFITPYVPFATASFIEQTQAVFISQIVISLILVWVAVCMRHEALGIIESVHQNQLVT
jgi:hypothetical protein